MALAFFDIVISNFETNFETNFPKNENLFYKSEVPIVVKSTTNESVTYPYKTALSEANVMTNRMGITKWTYQKEGSFASSYFIFLKSLFW